ncbi:MAG: recombination protein NinG [Patescibacteria group bacterium]
MRRSRPLSKVTLRHRLLKKLWSLFSEYVRKKSKGICFTCGIKGHYKSLDAGHYCHGRLDFDELNIQAQCTRCNRYLHGNLGIYAEKLIAKYGEAAIKDLRIRAAKVKKWEIEELQEKINYYQSAIEKLNKYENTSDCFVYCFARSSHDEKR